MVASDVSDRPASDHVEDFPAWGCVEGYLLPTKFVAVDNVTYLAWEPEERERGLVLRCDVSCAGGG